MKLMQRIINVFTDEALTVKENSKAVDEYWERESAKLVKRYQDQLAVYSKRCTELENQINGQEYGWSVDWDRIGTPFSVEWQKGTEDLKQGTLIGYWPPEGTYGGDRKVREWLLPITPKQHEEVVKDFEAWLDLKEESTT